MCIKQYAHVRILKFLVSEEVSTAGPSPSSLYRFINGAESETSIVLIEIMSDFLITAPYCKSVTGRLLY